MGEDKKSKTIVKETVKEVGGHLIRGRKIRPALALVKGTVRLAKRQVDKKKQKKKPVEEQK
jgi:hypothetical protein